MEHKEINRGWVKNAAIIFLAVLLVLTFFSNTIMNRTLPEVATQSVTSGSITARVRGTGTVVANGSYQVKADQTREIRAVAVKTGQEVNQGDVLFILGQGDSDELEAATDALRDLEISYRKSAINMPTFDYTVEERKIASAQEKYDAAVKSLSETKGDFKIELYNNGSVHTVQYWNSGWTVTYTDGAYGETTKAATPNPHTPTTITTK